MACGACPEDRRAVESLNTEPILIGNQMTHVEQWVRNPIERVVASRSLSFSRQQAQIRFASQNTRLTVLGAAHHAISAFFSKDRVTL